MKRPNGECRVEGGKKGISIPSKHNTKLQTLEDFRNFPLGVSPVSLEVAADKYLILLLIHFFSWHLFIHQLAFGLLTLNTLE